MGTVNGVADETVNREYKETRGEPERCQRLALTLRGDLRPSFPVYMASSGVCQIV